MSIIEVKNLQKRYRGQVAVDDVSLMVEKGEIFGIVGPNGAGKTTTVECIVGLRQADGGTIRVLGLDPKRDRRALRRRVGVQTQASSLPDALKVWEAVDLFAAFYPNPIDWRALLDELGLGAVRNQRIGHLSGGQRQRLSLALALVGNPEVAVLDELTTGLDPQARSDVWHMIEQIRRSGVTVLLVTHLMEEAERLCDRVAVIVAGRVVALDTPARMVAQAATQQRIVLRPSAPFDERLLASLPQVEHVMQMGDTFVLTGSDDLLHALTVLLVRHQIVPDMLRVMQPSLDDAYLALAGTQGAMRRSVERYTEKYEVMEG